MSEITMLTYFHFIYSSVSITFNQNNRSNVRGQLRNFVEEYCDPDSVVSDYVNFLTASTVLNSNR